MRRDSRPFLAAAVALRLVLTAVLLMGQGMLPAASAQAVERVRAQVETLLAAPERALAVKRPEAAQPKTLLLPGAAFVAPERPATGWGLATPAAVKTSPGRPALRLPPSRAPPFFLI